jgi:four helix bundle protein
MDLWVAIYRSTERWPKREWYGLAAQIRDAANSAGSNLAEGIAKRGLREMGRRANIALGSLTEVAHQLCAANKVGMLSDQEYSNLIKVQQRAARLTWLLIRGIYRRLNSDGR